MTNSTKLILLLGFVLCACDDDGSGSSSDMSVSLDTAQPQPDAAQPQPDAAQPQPDAAQSTSDASLDLDASHFELDAGSSPDAGAHGALMYHALVLHVEGWPDLQEEDSFRSHAALLRTYATIAEGHGALLTFEASEEFMLASAMWDDNVLLEFEDRGHAIGIHADIGGSPPPGYDVPAMVEELRAKRDVADALGLNIHHASGVCTSIDWVRAVRLADFEFATSLVGFCAMSMLPSLRPDAFSDCANPGECHGLMPENMADRIVLWRAASGLDWTIDTPNGLVLSAAAVEAFNTLSEHATDPDTTNSHDNAFDATDIAAYTDLLDQALLMADEDTVNIFHSVKSVGGRIDQDWFDDWLTAIDTYTANGRVVWATMPDVVTAYRASVEE